MRLPALVAVALAVVSSVSPQPATAQDQQPKPILKPSERDALALLFADYFKHRYENKELKALQKSLKELGAELDKRAKAAKITSLLESPVDLRSAMSGPYLPDKQAKKGGFHDATVTQSLMAGKFEAKYLYRLPKTYSEKTLLPLVIAFAPKLEKADAIKKWAESAFPEAIADTAIILVPLNPTGIDWMSLDGRQMTFFAVVDALRKFGVDRGRIFLDGHADSAAAVVHYAVRYPSLFTACILREPNASLPAALLSNARYVPLLLVNSPGGEAAKIATQFAQDCAAQGLKTTSVESAVEAGGKPGDAGASGIATFIAETRKNFAPRDLKFTTTSPEFTNSYWLELTKLEASETNPVTIEATVDRTKNEIHVTAPVTVAAFTIYVNQDLIDMGKEFKVLFTQQVGEDPKTVTRFHGKKGHNVDESLTFWFENKSGNYGEVYSNRVMVTAE